MQSTDIIYQNTTVNRKVSKLHNDVFSTLQNICKLNAFIDHSIEGYCNIERLLTEKMQEVHKEYTLTRITNDDSKNKLFQSSFTFDKDINTDFTIKKGLTIDANILGVASLHVFQNAFNKKYGDFSSHASFSLGSAVVRGKASSSIFNKKKFDPYIDIDLDARASILNGTVSGTFTKKNMNLSGDLDIGVGIASAQVKGVISKSEINVDAECGVAAVKGKAKGAVSIFGFKIEGSIGVEVGAIGVGAKFKKESNSIEIGGKFSSLFGLDLSIKISY